MRSDLPSGWVSSTLGEFAPLKYGKGLPAKDREASGHVPVFGSNGEVGRHSTPLISEAGLVVGRKGSIGQVHRSAAPFWPIDTTFFVTAGDARDLTFTYFLYKALEPRLAGMNTDSAVPGLNRDRAHAEMIAVPPLDEQRQISWVLGSIDDKIENSRRVATTLEQIAVTLFKARFVDFVDHDDLVESEAGEIPSGWSLVPIGELARYVNGKAFTKFGNGRGRMVIRIAELRSGPGGSTVYSDHETEPDFMATPGDILFAWSGSLDVYRWYRPEALVNQHIFKVIPEGYPAWFVFQALKHVMPHFQAIAADKATTMGHIKRGDLHTFSVAVPPVSDMEGHDAVFAPLFERALVARTESETLAQIRDQLLPRLISGSLRVNRGEGAAA